MITAAIAHHIAHADAALDADALAARDHARQGMAAAVAGRVQRAVIAGTLDARVLADAAMDYLAIAQDWEVAS